MGIRRTRLHRPTLKEFEERIAELTEAEAASPRVQWLVAECRRAREEAHSFHTQMRAMKGGKYL